MSDFHIGDRVKVISGPHEGRSGNITQAALIATDYREPEMYAAIEIEEINCFKEVQKDHISVPVRRLAPIR